MQVPLLLFLCLSRSCNASTSITDSIAKSVEWPPLCRTCMGANRACIASNRGPLSVHSIKHLQYDCALHNPYPQSSNQTGLPQCVRRALKQTQPQFALRTVSIFISVLPKTVYKLWKWLSCFPIFSHTVFIQIKCRPKAFSSRSLSKDMSLTLTEISSPACKFNTQET